MNNCRGEKLAVLGTAIAVQIASGISSDDATILGALFNVIGDQLTLIAAAAANNTTDSKDTSNSKADNAENPNNGKAAAETKDKNTGKGKNQEEKHCRTQTGTQLN
jgi:hypothetical protein